MAILCGNAGVRRRMTDYAAERDALLAAILAALRADERVVAAWLFGSLGRGTADELSDLDLFVVVADTHLSEVIASRHTMMAVAGAPLLVLEAPQNAPPGGAYNMALYDGADGAHQIDWYWQGRSAAAVPQQTLLLFDRVGLPRLDTPPHFDYQPVPERDPLEAAAQNLNFGWVMALIAAKYVARSPREEGMGLADYAYKVIRQVREFLTMPPLADDAPFAGTDPTVKIATLQGLCDQLLPLMRSIEARGGHAPWPVVEPARRYLRFIAAIATCDDADAARPSRTRAGEETIS